MKDKLWVFIVIGLVLVGLATVYQLGFRQSNFRSLSPTPMPELNNGETPGQREAACTEEAKLCPDGSYVARTEPNCDFAPCPEMANESGEDEIGIETETEQGVIPAGWQTYASEEFGFAISYPQDHQALDDANNLYGWSKGVVLIYGGGQAYDVVVEAWDSQDEYRAKYPPGTMNFTATKIGSKWITVADQTNEEVNLEIMGTFREIE